MSQSKAYGGDGEGEGEAGGGVGVKSLRLVEPSAAPVRTSS